MPKPQEKALLQKISGIANELAQNEAEGVRRVQEFRVFRSERTKVKIEEEKKRKAQAEEQGLLQRASAMNRKTQERIVHKSPEMKAMTPRSAKSGSPQKQKSLQNLNEKIASPEGKQSIRELAQQGAAAASSSSSSSSSSAANPMPGFNATTNLAAQQANKPTASSAAKQMEAGQSHINVGNPDPRKLDDILRNPKVPTGREALTAKYMTNPGVPKSGDKYAIGGGTGAVYGANTQAELQQLKGTLGEQNSAVKEKNFTGVSSNLGALSALKDAAVDSGLNMGGAAAGANQLPNQSNLFQNNASTIQGVSEVGQVTPNLLGGSGFGGTGNTPAANTNANAIDIMNVICHDKRYSFASGYKKTELNIREKREFLQNIVQLSDQKLLVKEDVSEYAMLLSEVLTIIKKETKEFLLKEAVSILANLAKNNPRLFAATQVQKTNPATGKTEVEAKFAPY